MASTARTTTRATNRWSSSLRASSIAFFLDLTSDPDDNKSEILRGPSRTGVIAIAGFILFNADVDLSSIPPVPHRH